MDKEIKERIAAINSGIIPEGYKKTKVGIVPVEWEEKIGIELFEYIRNGFVGTVSPFYVEKGHKYIQGNNIKDGKIVSDNLMYVNDEFYNSHKNSILKKGDIIIIQSGDVGKCALVTDEYENANCHALIIMTPYPETNTFFISYLLNSSVGFDMIKGFVTGNVLHHILASDYKELKYVIPPLPEQQKIAEILSTQDKLIELQEKKIEQLKALKKAYLQKMFPQKGSKYPELRFKGFTDPWEQRKLGELAVEVKRKAEKDSDAPVMMISAAEGFIDQSQRYSNNNAGSSLKNYTLLYEGELAYNHGYSKFRNFGSVFDLRVEKARIPFVYHSFALPEDDHRFYAYYLNSGLFDGELKKLVSSTARMDGLLNISYEDYMSIPVLRPPVKEQEKIGRFLTSLDDLITLHQRKSEQEKQKKKALMQLLLTGIVRTK